MKALHRIIVAAALAAGGPALALAQMAMDPSQMAGMKMDYTDGEVRKIDKDAGKITLKHGEIKNMDMPPMTMVFVVKDKAALDLLQPGDKVKFKAANEGGKLTVTEIQAAR